MAIKINFDKANNPERPTFVLAKRSGEKIGGIEAESIVVTDNLNDASEISFVVKKYKDGIQNPYWDSIVDFKLVWCKEWDMWFEVSVEINESDETEKVVYCKQLGIAELSQIMLYEIEINTEDDIARDDYKEPTIFYNELEPKASLLHRITEKVPHYTIKHVDHTLINIQRTFTFDGVSLYDAFQDIAKEIGCLFLFKSNSDENGNIQRSIEVYDLEANCSACRHRGDFRDKCPECGSTDINEGYGHDTTIFVSAEDIADKITFTTDVGSVKNCFRLEAGDDLMTAAVRMCNPNGSAYIWYLSDATKADMSSELVAKIESYDELYAYYEKDYVADTGSSNVTKYNNLVTKYNSYDETLQAIPTKMVGFPSLMSAYFNTIDMELFLESVLMPTKTIGDTDASKEARKLTASNISPVSVENLKILSALSADNAVLGMAKVLVDSRYKVKVANSSYDNGVWSGSFSVESYSDEDDVASSGVITVTINENYQSFTKQKIEKLLNKDAKDSSIIGLFDMSYNGFVDELKKYCLNSLSSFENAAQSCIDILIEQGISDKRQWQGSSPNLYNELYTPYLNKLKAIRAEMKVRESEIAVVSNMSSVIERIRDDIQDELNFENYLGETLFKEFSSFRREDKFTNDNFVSDGLDNAEIFRRANEFVELAKKEIYKSAELQHSITSTLKNLLIIPKFKPLVEYFEVGNWLRIQVDGVVYKLRLIGYEIQYDDGIENISVEFSDVLKTADGLSDQTDLLNQASSMASSYGYVQRQATQGADSKKMLDGWVKDGLDATNTKIIGGADNQVQTWDEHGMLFRRYNGILDDYDDIQMKIVNSTIAITDDSWESTRTAIGMFYYRDVEKNELVKAYGINAEVIVGKLILGEELGIYNSGGTMKFTKDGFSVANSNNVFVVNPNTDKLLNITHDGTSIFNVNKDGDLDITGNIKAKTLDVGGTDGIVFDGQNITIGKNVKISWNNVSDKPTIPTVPSGILTTSNYTTTITKDYIGTLKVVAGSVAAENITGTTITGKTFSGCTGTFSGTVTATAGTIGGWTVGTNAIYSGTNSLSSTTGGVYIGTNGIRTQNSYSKEYYITIKDGEIVCGGVGTSAKFTDGGIQLLSSNGYTATISCGSGKYSTQLSHNGFDIFYGNYGYVGLGLSGSNSGDIYAAGDGSNTPKISVFNDNNCADLRATNNAGVFHSADAGYSTEGWLIYISTGGTISTNSKSDARLKDIYGDISNKEALFMLKNVVPINYSYKDDKEKVVQNGFVAQNVRDCLIEGDIGYRSYLLIHRNNSDEDTVNLNEAEDTVNYGLDYSKFTPILWKGWQIHEKQIDELKVQIEELKDVVEKLKDQ